MAPRLEGGRALVLADMTRGARWYKRFWGLLYELHPKLMGGCRPVNAQPYLREAGWELVERKELSQFTFPSEVILATTIP